LASAVSTSGPVCIDLVQSQLLLDNVEYRERQLIACEEDELYSGVHYVEINIPPWLMEGNSEKSQAYRRIYTNKRAG